MKATRVHAHGGPEVLTYEETPDPVPGPGEVLVSVRAAGVNPVDTYIRSGSQGYSGKVPYTPGLDGAGLIDAIGAGVTAVKAGDRVYFGGSVTGAYAEKALCREPQVHPLPDHVSFALGACVWVPYGTAYRAIHQKARAVAGETILVHGASGGVGIASVQIAAAAGLVVIGTAGSAEGRRLVLEQGASHVVDHNDPGHLDEVVRITGGLGLDVILEMLANVNLGRDLKAMARGGRVVVIGSRGTVEIAPRDIMSRDLVVTGMALTTAPENEARAIRAGVGAGLRNGTLRPVVGRELPLAEARQAHEAVLASPHLGNIVLIP